MTNLDLKRFSADLPTNNADDAFMVCIYLYICSHNELTMFADLPMFRFLNRFINYRGTQLFAGL